MRQELLFLFCLVGIVQNAPQLNYNLSNFEDFNIFSDMEKKANSQNFEIIQIDDNYTNLDVAQFENSNKSFLEKCGLKNLEKIGFIVDKNEEDVGEPLEFSWTVGIFLQHSLTSYRRKKISYVCSGSLIHPRAVLTAAHCVATKSGLSPKWMIRAGDWDIQRDDDPFPHQDRNVDKILIHPKYNGSFLYNDIAILLLESPIEDAPNVGVVCLPCPCLKPNKENCYTTGWGEDVFGKRMKFNILNKVPMFIVEKKKCQADLKKTRLGIDFVLDRSFTCAIGEPEMNKYKGSKGSPLVCPMTKNQNKYVQSGIVSWGVDNEEDEIPTIFVDVARFRNWIDEQLIENNIDMSIYEE